MSEYLIIFYNRFACETQTYKVKAKNAISAGIAFYRKHSRKSYLKCIESISKEPEKIVMVVYAYDRGNVFINPWIYGVFKDKEEGFSKMEEMQNSKEYGHLIWDNKMIKIL